MGLTKLGRYIELFDERNTAGDYGADTVVGLSTQKEIIKTKANLQGVSLDSYKIFPPDSFAFVPDTSRRGDKMSLAFNRTEDTYLVSSISVVFKTIDSQKLNSTYLYIYFNRPEFDRYARFNSWGSAREAFSWEDMCDIDIDLPPIEIQQKYVDIYNSMLTNQQCYERGLDDLKISFEALLDEYKHKSARKTVGELLSDVDNRNSDGAIGEVCGININKQFMPTVADILNVDLKKYKLVSKGQFAFSGMQTGRDKCIRIALYDKKEPIIISPAYTVFEIKDEAVLPEYFMMWFSRKEIDRLGWFYSDASIRTNLDMDRFYEIEVPVPDLAVQKSIVEIYNAYKVRKAINEKLKAQIKDICPILIKGSLEEASR